MTVQSNMAYQHYLRYRIKLVFPVLLLTLLFVLFSKCTAISTLDESSQLEKHLGDHERIVDKLFFHLYNIELDQVFTRSVFESVSDTKDAWDVICRLKQNKLLILPSYALGLASRMRTISSMSVIANQLNRTLVVLWIRSYECNANSADLFTLVTSHNNSVSNVPTVMIDVAASIGNAEEGWLELYPSQELISHYVRRLAALRNDVITYYQSLISYLEQASEPLGEVASCVRTGVKLLGSWDPLMAIFRKPLTFDIQRSDWEHSADILIVWTLSMHRLSTDSASSTDRIGDNSDYSSKFLNEQRREAFYRHLVPTSTVASLLDKYREQLLQTRGEHLVGVHLRGFHPFYDWNRVPPVVRTHQWGRVAPDLNSCSEEILTEYSLREPENQQSVALRFDDSASLSDFVVTIQRLIAKRASILLISNDNDAKVSILKHFNKAIDGSDIGRIDGTVRHVVALTDDDVAGEDDGISGDDAGMGACSTSSSNVGKNSVMDTEANDDDDESNIKCVRSKDKDLAATESRSADRSSLFGMQLAMADLLALGGYLSQQPGADTGRHFDEYNINDDEDTANDAADTSGWVSPPSPSPFSSFFLPELIVHSKGSYLATEAGVLGDDIPVVDIVTTVHTVQNKDNNKLHRQVSFLLSSGSDSLYSALSSDYDDDDSVDDSDNSDISDSRRDGHEEKTTDHIRAEYLSICGAGSQGHSHGHDTAESGSNRMDSVRQSLSPSLRSRCDAMHACYIEDSSAERCVCTLLLKYTPCSVSNYMPLVSQRKEDLAIAIAAGNTARRPSYWLLDFLFERDSSVYCLDNDYHDLRRVQTDAQRPRIRTTGYGGDLLWVYAE